ncbi:MAG TPA: sulfatase-like hydrolase/transferase [Sedimentisphaerales bacterium]|nr:sulfatase-like hydrolase/transferase [Sedimentisphaerales bacterium]
MAKPNIVFLFSDQQRWDTLGCYGQKLPITPNLDTMAKEGVRFEYAFTPQPVCGPVRAVLQSGRYASQVGVFTNGIALPPGRRFLADWMHEAGYETAYIGKWHLASNGSEASIRAWPNGEKFNNRTSPIPRHLRGGYRDFWLAADALEYTSRSYNGHMFDSGGNKREFPPGRFRADAQTDWALEYLRGRKKDRPLFLFVSWLEPHHQNDRNRYEGPHGSKERFKDFVVPGDLEGAEGDWKENYADYLGCCHNLDANVGRIRKELERLGMAENTVVIYTSDHGSHFRTRNHEYKRSCHEGSIRVPLVMCGPGFKGGGVMTEFASLVDLPRTIADIAGAKASEDIEGRSLRELVDGEAKDWPQDVFVQISEDSCSRAIRTKKWKYSVRAPEGRARDGTADSDVYVEEYLYDLENDYHERENLVGRPEYADLRKELEKLLKKRMVEVGEAEPTIEPAGSDSEDRGF